MIKRNIPNLLTLCNLLCGCIAIVFVFEGNLVWSAYLVGIACVFDFLDGMVARALKVHSEIGKQLDSLADMVSFGVVPGAILSHLLNLSWDSDFLRYIIPSVGFLVTIFSAIRLAKFNLDTRQSDSFIGLPTPANAILISSIALIGKQLLDESNTTGLIILHNYILQPYVLILFSLISSALLVLPLPLIALKFKNFSWEENKLRYIFLVLAVTLLIVFQFVGIPLIIILYIVLSLINNIVSKSKHVSPTKYE